MTVKCVPTEGWTRGSVEATIRFVTQQQREAMAERVRTEMERRGWNNPKLAREAELSEKTISRVINARKDPRLDTIERIARAFGIDESQLRPPPPAPLGLGANGSDAGNGEPTQLDRIEGDVAEVKATLDQLLDELAARKIVAAVQKDAEQATQSAPAASRRRASGSPGR